MHIDKFLERFTQQWKMKTIAFMVYFEVGDPFVWSSHSSLVCNPNLAFFQNKSYIIACVWFTVI